LVKEQGLPTVALVAHYDTFGIAPVSTTSLLRSLFFPLNLFLPILQGLSTGANSNAGGVVALLELARLFSKLYTTQKSPPSYNLLFVITGGSRLNFAGSRNWLNTVEPRVLESLEFVLCLDTILGASTDKNGSSPLFLHVSRSPKDATIANFHQVGVFLFLFSSSLSSLLIHFFPNTLPFFIFHFLTSLIHFPFILWFCSSCSDVETRRSWMPRQE
jgi:hypothetical protein